MLCRVGKGTPAGEVFRRYWTPVLPSSDLPRPDGTPQAVTILGERLVAFRDTSGKVGLVDEFCPHRGASLAIGRVEDCGIRCLYHGWKFGIDGRIQETPNMPEESRFKDRNTILSYPVREAGGLIWAYLGPPERQPAFPDYFWFHVPPESLNLTEFVLPCNYLQVHEGSIDSSHLSVLHRGMNLKRATPDPEVMRLGGVVRFEGWPGQTMKPGSYIDNIPSEDMAPAFEVQNTDFGFQYAALRSSIYGPGRLYVRITTVVFPYVAYIPPQDAVVIAIPIDDEEAAFVGISVTDGDQAGRLEMQRQRMGPDAKAPGATRAERRVGMPAQDRAAMEAGTSFSGYAGGRLEDIAVQVSMGPMFDRHNEHLVSPADAGIVRYRHLLREDIRRVERGEDARFVVSGVEAGKVTAGSGIMPPGAPWNELVPNNHVIEG